MGPSPNAWLALRQLSLHLPPANGSCRSNCAMSHHALQAKAPPRLVDISSERRREVLMLRRAQCIWTNNARHAHIGWRGPLHVKLSGCQISDRYCRAPRREKQPLELPPHLILRHMAASRGMQICILKSQRQAYEREGWLVLLLGRPAVTEWQAQPDLSGSLSAGCDCIR